MKKLVLVSLIALVHSFTYAQNPQTDTNYFPKMVARPVFTWRSVVIPATMIAYGVIALKSDWFQDWNEGVKDELWTRYPHQQVHIDNYLQWAPAASTFALGFAGIKGRHNFPERVIILGMAELIQSSVVASIKKISGEARPNGGEQSFPSGHTSNAFTGAEFMRLEYKDVSPWYGVYGYLLAASTGFLRMYNNKHWLSDVLAGAGTGILSTDFTYYIYPKIKRLFSSKHGSHTIVFPTYNNGGPGIAVLRSF
jgi:membrane-associated phospholipid phosphatase